jgi:hypothetical protein
MLAMKMTMSDFEALSEKDQLYEKNDRRTLKMINHPFVIKVIDEINF